MIKREHYIEQIREFYDSDLIKITTGIRRCGKSVILEQVMSEIKIKSDNVIYLNFEDTKILNKIVNGDGLLNYVENNRKKGKCYVFLDEIQLLDNCVENSKTYEREFKPFSKLDNSCKKIFITNDEIDYSTSVVTHIKLKDFLLMKDLDS